MKKIEILAVLAAVLISACMSDSRYKFDKPQIGRLIGREGCKVSVPLSDVEVLRGLKMDGISDPLNYSEWVEFKAQQREGDEIRYIECESSGKDDIPSGIDGYALIRGNVIIANAFELIIN